jgi:hypothetical protein
MWIRMRVLKRVNEKDSVDDTMGIPWTSRIQMYEVCTSKKDLSWEGRMDGSRKAAKRMASDPLI